MKHPTVLLGLLLAATTVACAHRADKATPDPKACPDDAQVCADGSTVTREGPACEFKACPDAEPAGADGETPDGETPEGEQTPDGETPEGEAN